MSKTITYIITFLIVFVALPVCAYKFYFSYQDDLYTSLKEMSTYTTTDKEYTVKVMKYNDVGGEEKYTLKVYLIKGTDGTPRFIKTLKVSSYGVKYEYTQSETNGYEITLDITTSDDSAKLVIDCYEGNESGKKLRGFI